MTQKQTGKRYFFLAQTVLIIFFLLLVVVMVTGAPWSELPWFIGVGGLVYLVLQYALNRYWRKNFAEKGKDGE